MNKALIIYGSSTGNTEFTAETIQTLLSPKGYDVTLCNVSGVGISVFDEKYDLYLLGCSTWGEDEIELQDDFEPFYEQMAEAVSLTGKYFGIFGCGDTSYTHFCGAVDLIEERVNQLGGNLVSTPLKIDGEPEESQISDWVEDLTNAA